MIIGFGSIEEKAERDLEQLFLDHISGEYAGCDLIYFTDEFCGEMETWAQEQSASSQKASEAYKTAETFPDRYSYFWVSTVYSASHIIFIVKFHHVNRRHALSPDGWALMTNEKLIHVDVQSIKKKIAV